MKLVVAEATRVTALDWQHEVAAALTNVVLNKVNLRLVCFTNLLVKLSALCTAMTS